MNILQKLLSCLVAFMAIASLSACGTQPGDRAISGALIGGASGGLIYLLFPGSPVTLGMAAGASLGTFVGGWTLPEYLYLGEPVWKTYEIDPQGGFRRRPIPQNPQQMGQPQPQYQQQSIQQPLQPGQPQALQPQQQYQQQPVQQLQPTQTMQPQSQQRQISQPQQQPVR